jgi:hypothetical protein
LKELRRAFDEVVELRFSLECRRRSDPPAFAVVLPDGGHRASLLTPCGGGLSPVFVDLASPEVPKATKTAGPRG